MPASIFPDLKTLLPAVRSALRAWHTVGGTSATLLEGLRLVHERRAALGVEANPAALRRAANDILITGLDELATQDTRGAAVLRMRFLDADKALKVASRLNLSHDTINRAQRAAIHRLAEILWSRELICRERHIHTQEDNLQPAQYTQLFGLDQAGGQLLKQLLKPQAPWVAAIVGIGGIGKTALADATARHVIRQFRFDRTLWLRSESSRLNPDAFTPASRFAQLMTKLAEALWPAGLNGSTPEERLRRVRQALKSYPHLIVIDNLETEADTLYLVEHLNDLAAPSKFLLTARTRLSGQAAAFVLSLDELGSKDALALLRQHATVIGQTDLAGMTAGKLKPIYRVVGGNPLALKLVVGLATTQPLAQILADLERSRPGEIEGLYRHIYWKAWQALSPDARTLLQAMPLVAEPGAIPEQLRAISQLPDEKLWPSIHELATRSLLEVRGTAWERRYGVHRLTETFLKTEIIHWPDDAA